MCFINLTKCFVRHGSILKQILFAVPSKREGHFGGGSSSISMNIGNSSSRTLRAIGITPLYKSVLASSNLSATSFVVQSNM
jgi:hypothetical protein